MTALLIRLYGWLLRLYPRDFYTEFGEEIQATFAEAIREAAQRGLIAMAWFCLHERLDLTANLAFEHWTRFQKGNITMNRTSGFDNRPTSWLGTCIGWLPFLLFGPVRTWLAYPYPYAAGSISSWFFPNLNLLFGSCFLVGLVFGLMSGWQRWAFPYISLGILFLSGGKVQMNVLGTIGICVIIFILVLLLRVARRSMRLFNLRIRPDWTQFSFGLFMLAATAFGGVDHDEDPSLTFLVILPSVVVVLGALACLRSRTKGQRIASLLLGIALVTGVSIVREWFYILYGMIAITIVFLPALLEFLPQPNQTVLTE